MGGIVGLGGTYRPDFLIWAYRNGIFPWPSDHTDVLCWFDPNPRGILDFTEFHVGDRLQRTLRKKPWEIRVNTAFTQVMQNCKEQPRAGVLGSWITDQMITGYGELQRLGQALSVETWSSDDRLVGGIYGVLTETHFSAESMFFHESGASQFALRGLIHYLLEQKAMTWMDVQMVTPATARFGAKWIPREEFHERLGLKQYSSPPLD